MAKAILATVRRTFETGQPESLHFVDLDRELGSEIVACLEGPEYDVDESCFRLHYSAAEGYLRLTKASMVHECGRAWMTLESMKWIADGLITWNHFSNIENSAPTFDNFIGPYAGSKKEPDMALTPCIDGIRRDCPSVVLESGWWQSDTQSTMDSFLWLKGMAGAVKVVVLCKTYSNQEDKIGATLTLRRIHSDGKIITTERSVFPVDDEDLEDPFITIEELFSGSPPPKAIPDTRLPLRMQSLRRMLSRDIEQSGRLPA